MSLLKTTLVAAALSIAATAGNADSSVPVQDTPVPNQYSQTWSNARASYASTQGVKNTSQARTQVQFDAPFTRDYTEQHSGH
jgi:hypothetical protein